MKENYGYSCSQCGGQASEQHLLIRSYMVRLIAVCFLCTKCGTIGFDQILQKEIVGEWGNKTRSSEALQTAINLLQDHVRYYVSHMGYREGIFVPP